MQQVSPLSLIAVLGNRCRIKGTNNTFYVCVVAPIMAGHLCNYFKILKTLKHYESMEFDKLHGCNGRMPEKQCVYSLNLFPRV